MKVLFEVDLTAELLARISAGLEARFHELERRRWVRSIILRADQQDDEDSENNLAAEVARTISSSSSSSTTGLR